MADWSDEDRERFAAQVAEALAPLKPQLDRVSARFALAMEPLIAQVQQIQTQALEPFARALAASDPTAKLNATFAQLAQSIAANPELIDRLRAMEASETAVVDVQTIEVLADRGRRLDPTAVIGGSLITLRDAIAYSVLAIAGALTGLNVQQPLREQLNDHLLVALAVLSVLLQLCPLDD